VFFAIEGLALAAGQSTPSPSSSGVQTLTLDEAILRAVEHAPRLAEARARKTAAESSREAKRATAWPSATLSSSIARNNHVDEVTIPIAGGGTRVLFPDIPNNYRLRGELFLPIYAFGRVGATLSAAQSDIDAAIADERAIEADVRFEAARAYWTLVSARATVRLLEESLARYDAHVTTVRARVEAGVLAPNDLLTAQAQRARQSVRLVQAQNDAAVAELDLARLIGATAGASLRPATPVTASVPAAEVLAARSVDELAAGVPTARSEGASLDARAASLHASARAALANLRPYATGIAALEPARPNVRFVPPTDEWRTSWTLGVNVTWPVFDSGRSRAEAAALTAQAGALEARRRDFDNLAALDVRQRVLDITAGRAAIAASAEAVAAAAEARRVVDERFRAGVATNSDVLDAQVALLEAEVERARLLASLRIAEARLIRVAGDR
jgi:outer membrane protein TolC